MQEFQSLSSKDYNQIYDFLEQEVIGFFVDYKGEGKTKKALKILGKFQEINSAQPRLIDFEGEKYQQENFIKWQLSRNKDVLILAIIINEKLIYCKNLADLLVNSNCDENPVQARIIKSLFNDELDDLAFKNQLKILGGVSQTQSYTMHPDSAACRSYLQKEVKLLQAIDDIVKMLQTYKDDNCRHCKVHSAEAIQSSNRLLRRKRLENDGSKQKFRGAFRKFLAQNYTNFILVNMKNQARLIADYNSWHGAGAILHYQNLCDNFKSHCPKFFESFSSRHQFELSVRHHIKKADWLKDKDGKKTSTAAANEQSYKIRKIKTIKDHQRFFNELFGDKIFADKNLPHKFKKDLVKIKKSLAKFLSKVRKDIYNKSLHTEMIIDVIDDLIKKYHRQLPAILIDNLYKFAAFTSYHFHFEMRLRQEAHQHAIAVDSLFKNYDIGYLDLTDNEKSAFWRDLFASNKGRKIIGEIKKNLHNRPHIYNNCELYPNVLSEYYNFCHYLKSSAELLQLSQWHHSCHNDEVIFLSKLAANNSAEACKIAKMDQCLLIEDPAIWDIIINKDNDPKKGADKIFDNCFCEGAPMLRYFDLRIKKYQNEKTVSLIRILLALSDNNRLANGVGALMQKIGVAKLEEYFAEKFEILYPEFCRKYREENQISPKFLEISYGVGTQAARGFYNATLQKDVTWQNSHLEKMLRRQDYANAVGVALEKQIEQELEIVPSADYTMKLLEAYINLPSLSFPRKRESSKAEKLDSRFRGNDKFREFSSNFKGLEHISTAAFCLEYSKNILNDFWYLAWQFTAKLRDPKNGYGARFGALINNHSLTHIFVEPFKLHRAERDDNHNLFGKSALKTINDLKDSFKPRNFDHIHSRAITMDFAQSLWEINKWLAIFLAFKELKISPKQDQLLKELFADYKEIREVISDFGLINAHFYQAFMMFSPKIRPKSERQLQKLADNLQKNPTGKNIAEERKALELLAYFYINYQKALKLKDGFATVPLKIFSDSKKSQGDFAENCAAIISYEFLQNKKSPFMLFGKNCEDVLSAIGYSIGSMGSRKESSIVYYDANKNS